MQYCSLAKECAPFLNEICSMGQGWGEGQDGENRKVLILCSQVYNQQNKKWARKKFITRQEIAYTLSFYFEKKS